MESIFNSIRSSDKLCENNKNIELILEYQKFTAFNENNRVKAKELKKLFNDYEFFIISNKYNINLYNNCLFFTPTEAIKIGNLKLNKSQNTIRSYYIEFLRDYHDMLERDIIEFPKKEVNRKLFYDFIWYNLLPEKRREEFIKQIT